MAKDKLIDPVAPVVLEVIPNEAPAVIEPVLESVEREKTGKKRGPKGRLDVLRLRIMVASMIAKGMSQRTICKVLNLHHKTVSRYAKETLENYPEIRSVIAYEKDRKDIITNAERKSLKSIHKRLDKGTLRDSVLAFKVLHHAGRLERGVSTDNKAVSVTSFTKVSLTNIPDPEDDR